MQLLDDALKRLKTTWLEADEWPAIAPQENTNNTIVANRERFNQYTSGRLRSGNNSVVRLRTDWEVITAVVDESPKEDIANLIIEQLRHDLESLIKNGDTSSQDGLLQALDGSKKRGTEPKDVDILASNTFSEYFSKKKSYEFTVYLILYVEWEDLLVRTSAGSLASTA